MKFMFPTENTHKAHSLLVSLEKFKAQKMVIFEFRRKSITRCSICGNIEHKQFSTVEKIVLY